MDLKSVIFISIIIVVPFIFLFFIMLSGNRKIIKNFNKLKEKYSLNCDYSKKVGMKTHPSASGMYRNRKIKIETIIRDSIEGSKVIPHTAVLVECPNPKNFSFSVVKRKRKNNALFLSGSSLIDDNEFDDKFIIRSNDIERLRKIFDFNTRFKFDQAHKLGFDGIINLDGNLLSYIDSGILNDDNSLMRMELVMHELCDIADAMKYN